MTNYPRITISLTPDIENAVNKIKSEPGNEHTPKSRIVCGLVREALETRDDERTQEQPSNA